MRRHILTISYALFNRKFDGFGGTCECFRPILALGVDLGQRRHLNGDCSVLLGDQNNIESALGGHRFLLLGKLSQDDCAEKLVGAQACTDVNRVDLILSTIDRPDPSPATPAPAAGRWRVAAKSCRKTPLCLNYPENSAASGCGLGA